MLLPWEGLDLGPIRRIQSHATAFGYILRLTFRLLFDVSHSEECRTKKAFKYVYKFCCFFVLLLSSVVPTDCLISISINNLLESYK